jgi:hypothetical protein
MKYRTESALQSAIIKALRDRGFWVVRRGYKARRSNIAPQSGEPGEPDLEIRGLGHLEVKLPGETLTPAQIVWHLAAREIGLRLWTVDSVEEAIGTAEDWRASSSITKQALARSAMVRKRGTPWPGKRGKKAA